MNKVKEVLKNIKSDSNGNYLYCHYGLRQVLGMLYDAAGGITKTELADWKLENAVSNEVTSFNKKTAINPEAKISQEKSKNIPIILGMALKGLSYTKEADNNEIKNTLLSGNLLLINQDLGVKIKNEYNKLLQTKYSAQNLFYSESNLKDIVKEANDFIAEHTGGHIKNAVNEDDMKNKAVKVTNSVYFYSKWSHKLAEAGNISFKNSKNDIKEVEAVKGMADKYISNEYLHGFSYAYANRRYSFIALMLKEDNREICWQDIPDFDDIKPAYRNDSYICDSGENIKNVGLEIADKDVYFTMPKFKIDAEINFDSALKAMGIKNIYDLNADLSKGFSSETGLYLSNIAQKTGIIVDENGTEGWSFTDAAVTICIREKVELIFDKPYFFIVYDEVDKQPVFAGIVNNPQWN